MRIRNNRTGAVTVEFALVCPVFLMLIFGLIEFSRISIIRHAVDNAAYEAARVGIIPGATATEVTSAVQASLDAVGLTATTILVTPFPLGDSADDVTVEVTVSVADNSWGVPHFAQGLNLTGSASLGTERYRGFAPPASPPP